MQPPRAHLIGSGTSPFVRKVRVAMIEKGIGHDFEASPAWNPASPANVLNPLQKVPVLCWPGRAPLFDSPVIVQALELWVPAPALLPADPERRLQALQIEALADGVCDAAALYTQEGWRAPETRSAYWLERQRAKVSGGLAALEASIEPWLPPDGQVPNLAALAAGAAVAFVSRWQPAIAAENAGPRMEELLRRLEQRPAWRTTHPVVPAGAMFPRL